MLKTLLIACVWLACSACATTPDRAAPGAPAADVAPVSHVAPGDDLSLALEALRRSGQRLDDQAARLKALQVKVKTAPRLPR